MTVNATYNPITYPGAGTAAPLSVTWPFGAATDLLVVEVDNATNVETARSLGVHYTVTQNTTGGIVTPVSSIAVGKTWKITRVTPKTQPDTLRLGGAFSEATVEAMFDRAVRMIQEQDARITSGDTLLRGDLQSAVTGLGLGLSGTAAGGAITQSGTSQHFGQNGARIHRLNDRILIGGATANDGLFPNVAKDWLTTYQESIGLSAGTLVSATVAVLSTTAPNSSVPILSGVQSQYFNNTGTTGLAVAAYALANNNVYNNDMWAYYAEARRNAGVNAEVYGGEIDCSALSATISPDPYTYGDVGGWVVASGGEFPAAGQFDTSFGIALYGNGSKFKAGLVMRADSLVDLGGGVKEAIQLPTGSLIRSWTGAGAPGSFIYFATTTAAASPSVQLANGAFSVTETSGGVEQFRVVTATGRANYPMVTGSATGVAVQYGAQGTDADIDVTAAPKGTGRFGVSYAATTATTPASFSATRIVPVKCNGTLVYLAGSTAAW